MRSVSSNVMLPELPDAKMETRKPIAHPSENQQGFRPVTKQIFKIMAEGLIRVNGNQRASAKPQIYQGFGRPSKDMATLPINDALRPDALPY